jgi:hypothetical protein
MGSSMLLWFIPYAPDMKGEGLFFPKIPEVLETQNKPKTSFDNDQYINKALTKYGKSKFACDTD